LPVNVGTRANTEVASCDAVRSRTAVLLVVEAMAVSGCMCGSFIEVMRFISEKR
jgi:hypothetical protein